MELTILSDNHTLIDRYLLGEPAFSCYLSLKGQGVLLDTGYFGTFAQNAEALNLPWRQAAAVVLSHTHNDHTRGLKAFFCEGPKPRLYAHPALFRPVTDGGLPVGCPYSREETERYFDLHLSKEPVEIARDLFYLGEIPYVTDFEPPMAVGTCRREPDFCPDDTALAYRGREGVYVITGCSHRGIGNIIERAKAVTGQSRVLGVIGGFHLMELNKRAEATIEYLKKQQIPCLCPCHCTALRVKAAMLEQMPLQEVGVGTKLIWE